MNNSKLLQKLHLSHYSLRDLLAIGLPALLLIIAGFYFAAQYIRPAPPKQLTLSTGAEGGAYEGFALKYKDVLAQYGIELILKPSAGAIENLTRIRAGEVDAAFIQSGIAEFQEEDELQTLGSLYNEPLWIFFRAEAFTKPPTRLSELRGKRIAIGAAGSGTRQLALAVLNANGIHDSNARLRASAGQTAIQQLNQGQVDVVMTVGTPHSATVWQLLYTPSARLMSLREADAYTRHFPYLAHVVLPEGAIDLVNHLPPHDVDMVTPTATLAINADLHPALIDVLLWATSEVHGKPGIFQRPHEFPKPGHNDFPVSPEAERYYKNGKPLLQRYLPFWAATLVDRMVVMLIPLLAVLVPIFKFAPALYTWRIRSRIDKRYGALKLLEGELLSNPTSKTQVEWLERLEQLERGVNRLPTPLPYTSALYTLRSHIALVREVILQTTKPA